MLRILKHNFFVCHTVKNTKLMKNLEVSFERIIEELILLKQKEVKHPIAADGGGVAPGGAVQAALRVSVGVGAVGGGEGAGDLPERARRPRQVPGD